jgi:pyrimidine-nucleoside phosphorylase
MFPQEIIVRKRDGAELTAEEIGCFVRGVVSGEFADYQSSALLMAILLRGMSVAETVALTEAMMRSGQVLDLGDIPGVKVDKHSTGGVGDKVSLVLAPLVAACGVPVPMMSGRGLGHTGGTLDKLESIPGFRTGLSVVEYRAQLARLGVAMIGQTAELAPADRKLYALRDVTGTVESIPLICASIMAKKLAEGIDALVLDVKFGRGAFMKTLPRARELAETMVGIGRSAGRPTTALLTAMDQPLGRSAGNAVEVAEALDCLRGHGPADLMEVTLALGAQMLVLGRVAATLDAAHVRLGEALSSGRALEKFRELIEAQGGDPHVVDDPASRLPKAKFVRAVRLPDGPAGYAGTVDALRIGQAVMALGGGRGRVEAQVDPAVGVTELIKTGTPLRPGDELAILHANDESRLAEAVRLVQIAVGVQFEPVKRVPLLAGVIE